MKKLILTAAGFFVLVLMTTGHQSYGQGYTPAYGGVPTAPVMDSLTTGSRFYGRSRRSQRSQPSNYGWVGADTGTWREIYRRGTSHDSNVNANAEQIKSGDKIVTVYQAPLMSETKILLMVKPDTELTAKKVQRNQSGNWVSVTVSGVTGWINQKNLTVNSSEKVFSWKKLSGGGEFYDSSAKLIIIGGTTRGPNWNGGRAQLTVKTRPRKIKKIGVFIDTQGARWWRKGVHSLRRGGTVDIYVNKVRIHRIVCNVRGQHGGYWSQEAGLGSAGYDTGFIDVSNENINGPLLNIKIVANSGSAVDINGITVSFEYKSEQHPAAHLPPAPDVEEKYKYIPGYQPNLGDAFK